MALCQPTPSADLVAASSLRPEAENQLRPWPIMFLARDADLSLIRVKLIERQGYFLIDTLRSPVIEWSPPIWVRRNWKKGPSGSYESPAARPG